jgi:hypothetical protein
MNVVDILSIVAAFAVTGWFVRTVWAKDRDVERFAEDDAREFFDEHGHWPDETPEQAAKRAQQAAHNERLARSEDRD